MDDIDEKEDIIRFIQMRLDEIQRLSRSLSVSEALNVQASVDQLERLTSSVISVVNYVRYYEDNPLGLPLLKKIANNWSYHSDFDASWKIEAGEIYGM